MVILNGSDEDVELMLIKMESRAARAKADKKDKKSKKNKASATVTSFQAATDEQPEIANSSSSASSSKLLKNVVPSAVTATIVPTAAVASSAAGSSKMLSGNVKPFMKREAANPADHLTDPAIKKLRGNSFNVAADPKATEVYKSLFTSHKSEQEQTRAHWVTYNPFYN